MPKQNNLRQTRKIIYTLKRTEGLRIQVINAGDTVINFKDGDVDRTYDTRIVKKAVILPNNSTRDFVYDLAYIAANKNFTSGGFFDKSIRTFLIDRKDLKDFAINLSSYIRVMKTDTVYNVKKIDDYEDDAAYIIIAQHVDGFDLSDIPLTPSVSP